MPWLPMRCISRASASVAPLHTPVCALYKATSQEKQVAARSDLSPEPLTLATVTLSSLLLFCLHGWMHDALQTPQTYAILVAHHTRAPACIERSSTMCLRGATARSVCLDSHIQCLWLSHEHTNVLVFRLTKLPYRPAGRLGGFPVGAAHRVLCAPASASLAPAVGVLVIKCADSKLTGYPW